MVIKNLENKIKLVGIICSVLIACCHLVIIMIFTDETAVKQFIFEARGI